MGSHVKLVWEVLQLHQEFKSPSLAPHVVDNVHEVVGLLITVAATLLAALTLHLDTLHLRCTHRALVRLVAGVGHSPLVARDVVTIGVGVMCGGGPHSE